MERCISRRFKGQVLVLALLAVGCGETETPPQTDLDGWSVLEASPDSGMGRRHDDVFFLDPSNGWLVNTRGETYRTSDAGASWTQLGVLAGVPLRCVGFVTAERGWAGNINTTNNPTPDRALFETLDGGRRWTNISARIQGPQVVGLCGLRVVSASTAVAVGRWNGPPVFVRTTDGGRTWISRDLRPQASGLVDVHFFDQRSGVAVGGLGVGSSEAEQRSSRTVILATGDGGATWETRYASASVGQWAWKVHFVSRQVGYVTTEGPTPDGSVLKTTDGGRTWQRLLVEAGRSFEGVGFVTPERGWVASPQTLFATSDGGATWRSLGFGLSINRMRVLGEDQVVACGQRVYRWTR
jgi:photosystem II stability/assembly factor-like uncharacterized protein